MSATAERTTSKSTLVENETYQELIEVFKVDSDSFRRWDPKKDESGDIDAIHVRNVIKSLQYKDSYQRLKERLMREHHVNERDLVSGALHWFAARRR